ncbi:GIY-YIG nuclease family protein [Psychroserpens burtonensis]|uniref:GIY-YIG nuclease family protein n=1 Tax=Psychroserpens burtonensis TaxID=49278 RepID=A0A5C7B5A6_9FLAO|nr:GIY-YIG nuclease family protein [Psychroserpens burtonensis]
MLKEIFENDPLGLLIVKPKKSAARTSDERLAASFDEINNFIENNDREPKPDPTNISEYKLYSTLKGLRDNDKKMLALEPQDKYELLNTVKKEINSINDIFGDDSLDILGDDSEGIFDFKHTPKDFDRAKADFVGKRVKCKDFDKYEHLFKEVQNDLALGKRKLVDFKEPNLREGTYYVHNGVLFLLESITYEKEDHYKDDGTRVRKDGRTRCIFENGTESNILKRSVEKNLYKNGKVVTQNIDSVNKEFTETFNGITEEDKETGHIYVLKSKSKKEEISSITNLYKIGYSSTSVQERIMNAENEPTYLMAPVKIESSWSCYNMNAQKFEQLIHQFFGNSCLEVDVFDKKGIRHTPREWFIVPLEAVEQSITLIISGKIVNYSYDKDNEVIIEK